MNKALISLIAAACIVVIAAGGVWLWQHDRRLTIAGEMPFGQADPG